MSVGLLLITDGEIGNALHNAAISVIGSSTLRTRILAITDKDDPESLIPVAQSLVKELDTGNGVLVLNDMYGSTPSNISCTLKSFNVAIISGINLPMLIRIMNYPNASLTELADKAINAGVEGIVQCKIMEQGNAATGS